MSQLWPRTAWLPALALAVGCQDNYEMVTAALNTVSESSSITGTETDATGATGTESTTADVPTTTAVPTTSSEGSMSDSNSGGTDSTTSTTGTTETTGWDPTATTGPPATCEAPEDCTGMGSGDLSTFVLPFFRGEVCYADKLRPGDGLPISWNPCVHPCIDPKKTGWRYLVRCDGGVGCEIAFLQYYREATGSDCPSDVFAKFPKAGCKYLGPHYGLSEGLKGFGYPDDKLLVPFITNADAAAANDLEPAAQVWTRIDGYMQPADRYIPLSVSADNPAPPTMCGPDVPGCTCKEIGF
ncbi:hypothetical protein [Nannocystis punicea]|uniref:Uncharacterized protein n=1 Tax=Nannocystis punicea TaxID=2995304 RepID=A0ABY7GTY4_9BACT|nr:hypothetical protein [Nannocystis poenicansa]WAS90412.1 hypothetical protein O0S08_29845 [Nannocystis poenicansa]